MIVSDHTALVSSYSWPADPAFGRTVITYALPTVLPDYLPDQSTDNAAFLNSFQAVTGTAANLVRQAMSIWEAEANIQLIEVDRSDADINLGLYDFSLSDQDDAAGYAYFPSFLLFGNGIEGDVLVDINYANQLWIWLHEVGHALGLEHPHEGTNTLAGALDNTSSTVMSYNGAKLDRLGALDDEAIQAIYGTDVSLNLIVSGLEARTQASVTMLQQLRDYGGNSLGGDSAWQYIGSADVQLDGDQELIFVNAAIGRWATLGPDSNDLINFSNHGAGGDTRVVGIYIDPLVEAGVIAGGNDHDSQQRFANDLAISNLDTVLGAADYDGDGLQEMYLKTTDGSAYLHMYMHADGNIRYANYQSEQQMTDYLIQYGYTDYQAWITA